MVFSWAKTPSEWYSTRYQLPGRDRKGHARASRPIASIVSRGPTMSETVVPGRGDNLMDALSAARAQMALSLGFHMIFAAFGIGLPLLMLMAEGLWLRTG